MEQKPKRNYRHSFWVWITWVKRIIATFALVCVLGLCSLMSIATLHTFLEIPDMVERLVTASCRVDWDRLKHIGQQILIDQTHPDYWTVYFIIWYM
jgi:hypothetical protein